MKKWYDEDGGYLEQVEATAICGSTLLMMR